MRTLQRSLGTRPPACPDADAQVQPDARQRACRLDAVRCQLWVELARLSEGLCRYLLELASDLRDQAIEFDEGIVCDVRGDDGTDCQVIAEH